MTAQTLEPILKGHSIFKGLDPRHLALIVGCASNVRFKAGRYIFREGGDANHFYLIRRGKVVLEVYVPGRGALTIETIEEGDVLGWSWLFPPYHWHFDARAAEDTLAIAMDGACLRSKCDSDHDLGYDLMKRFSSIMTQRLQATRLQLLDVYGTTKK